MAQHSISQPTHFPAPYLYYPGVGPTIYSALFVYVPGHQFPSAHVDLGGPSAAYRMNSLVNRNGGLYSAAVSTHSWWYRSEPSISSFNGGGGAIAWNQPVATDYMHGSNIVFFGPPQVPVYIPIPYISNPHHNPIDTQHLGLRGRNQPGHNDAMCCPGPPSRTAPRYSSPHVSGDASSSSGIQRRAPRDDSPQVSANTPPGLGSGILGNAPRSTGPPTSVIQQLREAEPGHETNSRQNRDFHARVLLDDEVLIIDFSDDEETEDHVDAETQNHVTVDSRITEDIIESMRSSTRSADETIIGRLETIEQPSTSVKNREATSCTICLDVYEDQHEIQTLNCGHEYHSDCIKKWLRRTENEVASVDVAGELGVGLNNPGKRPANGHIFGP
ncbi:hypothetical protein CRG98_020472 [Punica granatum]|uniref:RING-type E3 ubiquitin transferase n=1 Tax=Punica granatum TaxID=22663 RepID=A0A2I0JUG1_PUNGR|nr:hypothetical protein CRG98_020472 [Punica granatum]